MKTAIQQRLQLFADNSMAMRKGFVWHSAMTGRLAALIYAQKNLRIDVAVINQSYNLIKNKTGVFSTFRGNMSICIAAFLSLSKNPEYLLDNTLNVYELMKEAKFVASSFLVVAAYQIASGANPSEYKNIIYRTKAIYDGLKKNHRFYTGYDDYVFTAMLGISGLDVNVSVEKAEAFFQRLKFYFSNMNSVQALSQILVLSESTESTVERILELRDSFKYRRMRYDKAYTLPSLGVLALLPIENKTIIGDLEESYAYLRDQKGLKSFSVSQQEMLLHIMGIITSEYLDSARSGIASSALTTAITNILIAQQAAMIAAVSASGAAATAASTSSH